MAIRVVAHVHGEERFVADLEELPGPMATNIYLTNPCTSEHKPVAWITGNLRGIVLPKARIILPEVVITRADQREVVGFYNDDSTGN